MKKMEKITVIINTISAALEQFRKEVEMQVGQPVLLYNYEAYQAWKGGEDYYQPDIFITLLDKGGQRISGNYVANEYMEEAKSGKVSDLINENDFNILYYLWGKEAKIKDIRYANIAQRKFIERPKYTICKEKGWVLDIFKRVATPYEKSFIYSRKEVE